MGSTPTPEEDKNPEYLKELQAEKDSLEAAVVAVAASASNDEANSEKSPSEAATSAVAKTNHAIKLLEQGKNDSLLTKEVSLLSCL